MKSIKNKLFTLLTLLIPALAYGEKFNVEVIKSSDTVSIRLPLLQGDSGKTATEILTSDLERSGCVKIVSSGGDYTIQGSASESAVKCSVFKSDGSSVLTPSASGNLRRSVHQVADEIVFKLTGQKGIAQSRVAFISDKTGRKELYVMDYDAANVKYYTSDKTMVVSPHFNAQTSKIAYTSYRSGFPDVYIMGYPGGSSKRIAAYPGLNSGAAFSPNGSKVALTLSKDGNPELYTMSSEGGGLKRMTRTRGGESSPSWSPDGSQIAYASDEGGRPQIYIISSSGGNGKRITSSPAYNTEPDWSLESGKIAYCSLRGSQFAISVLDPKGGGGDNVYSNGSCEDPSWAPNGRHLVFSRTVNYHSELYILDTITKEAIQLTRDFGNCTEPTWSGR